MGDRLAQNLAEVGRQREHGEQRRRDRVVAEFGGDPNGMAEAIMRYRHALKQLADAIDWIRRGAPVTVVPPGPYTGSDTPAAI
jgi:hypothetical protein